MGSDACWLEVEFRRSDLPKFNEILAEHIDDEGIWWSEELGDDPDSGTMKVTVYEANNAWGDELSALAGVDLSFRAEHGGGDEYGPCVLVCYEGDLVECNSDFTGTPNVPVYRDGLSPEHYLECRKYWGLVYKFEEEPEIT